jgi:hypothetical protein
MVINHSRISRVLILVLVAVMLYVLWTYGYRNPSRESVVYSTLACVRSVCTESPTTGDLCSMTEPRVSEILIESDPESPNIKTIRVIPSDDKCQ